MINVYDFFSGCGGTSAGLQKAGLDIVLGLDLDASAAKSYSANFRDANFIRDDITRLHPDCLRPWMDRRRPSLFAGCAPCQPFSKQNNLKTDLDSRSGLLMEFARFVEYWLPDYVLIENVPGLQKVASRYGLLKSFKHLLRQCGYHIADGIVSARSFGVPQKRDRFILLASLVEGLDMPSASHGEGLVPFTTVRDFIHDLPPLAAGAVDPVDVQHASARLSDLNIKRIKATLEGGGRETWLDVLRLRCHNTHKGHSDVYGRLAWDKPAAGLTTRCISYSNGRFGHPEQDRAISIREAACLQTFDRSFEFYGSLEDRARQVGNAVPPAMATALGRVLLAHQANHVPKD